MGSNPTVSAVERSENCGDEQKRVTLLRVGFERRSGVPIVLDGSRAADTTKIFDGKFLVADESHRLRKLNAVKTAETEQSRITTLRWDSNGLAVYSRSNGCRQSGDQKILVRRN